MPAVGGISTEKPFGLIQGKDRLFAKKISNPEAMTTMQLHGRSRLKPSSLLGMLLFSRPLKKILALFILFSYSQWKS